MIRRGSKPRSPVGRLEAWLDTIERRKRPLCCDRHNEENHRRGECAWREEQVW